MGRVLSEHGRRTSPTPEAVETLRRRIFEAEHELRAVPARGMGWAWGIIAVAVAIAVVIWLRLPSPELRDVRPVAERQPPEKIEPSTAPSDENHEEPEVIPEPAPPATPRPHRPKPTTLWKIAEHRGVDTRRLGALERTLARALAACSGLSSVEMTTDRLGRVESIRARPTEAATCAEAALGEVRVESTTGVRAGTRGGSWLRIVPVAGHE